MNKKIIIILILGFLFFSYFVLALDKVEINTATLEQLDTLTGIGPVMAQRITDARPFSSLNDLLRVSGIGEKTLQKIKDQGLAYVDADIQHVAQTLAPAPIPLKPSPEISHEQTYSNGVIINEILPSPKGADETDEWIELYNSNNFDVDLSGWKLLDTNGTPTTFIISQNTKIYANGFLIFKRPDTKIMLNNDADGLNLLAPDGKIIDLVDYTSAPIGQSYNKTNSGWMKSATLTPGAVNIVTAIIKAPSTSSGTNGLPKTKTSDKNNIVGAGLADISQVVDVNQEETKATNPWFLFYTALAITIISASIILFIKLRLFKTNVRT